MRVLLVEDDASLADVLARNLRARGYSVRSEHSASGAITSMAEEWPDALLLDVNLPDESGWEILRRVGQRSRESLGVIVISAAPISAKRIAEFQPARWFQKPFPIDALVRALKEIDAEADGSQRTGTDHLDG